MARSQSTSVFGNRRTVAALMAVLCAAPVLAMSTGCVRSERNKSSFRAAWKPGVEVRFPMAGPGPALMGSSYEMRERVIEEPYGQANVVPESTYITTTTTDTGFGGPTGVELHELGHDATLVGTLDCNDLLFTLKPDQYAFSYRDRDLCPVYGVIEVYPVRLPRAKDFIRHSIFTMTPDPTGAPSVFSASELSQARNGHVITKVVFMADLAAVRKRLDTIDHDLFEFDRLRITLTEQNEYWNRKLTQRRMNTRYSSEFGWGVDIPAWDLSLLQCLVGAERYHWHRFSQAEDQVRTYERQLANIDLPQRDLAEEREALRQLMGSSGVICRTGEMLVLGCNMVRPFHDPVFEVTSLRGNPRDAELHMPYLYSSLPNKMLPPALRPILTPGKSPSRPVGEVLMVVTIGPRGPL